MFPGILIQLLFVLLIVGVLLYVLAAIPGIDATIKQFVRILVIAITAIWVLYALFGVFGGGHPRF